MMRTLQFSRILSPWLWLAGTCDEPPQFVTRIMDFASVVPRGSLGLESDGQAVVWEAWTETVAGMRRSGVDSGSALSNLIARGRDQIATWVHCDSRYGERHVVDIHFRVEPGAHLQDFVQEYLVGNMCVHSVAMTSLGIIILEWGPHTCPQYGRECWDLIRPSCSH